jgi:hypothetical protein
MAMIATLAPAKTYIEHRTITKEIPAYPTLHPNTWDVSEAADHLREKGFLYYAQYCLDNQLNGMMLLAIEKEDVDEMPEQHKIKKKTFLSYINYLKERWGV